MSSIRSMSLLVLVPLLGASSFAAPTEGRTLVNNSSTFFGDEAAFFEAAGGLALSKESFEDCPACDATNSINLMELATDLVTVRTNRVALGVYEGDNANRTHPTDGTNFLQETGANSIRFELARASRAFAVTITDLADCNSCGRDIAIRTNSPTPHTPYLINQAPFRPESGSDIFVGVIASEPFTVVTIEGFSSGDGIGFDEVWGEASEPTPTVVVTGPESVAGMTGRGLVATYCLESTAGELASVDLVPQFSGTGAANVQFGPDDSSGCYVLEFWPLAAQDTTYLYEIVASSVTGVVGRKPVFVEIERSLPLHFAETALALLEQFPITEFGDSSPAGNRNRAWLFRQVEAIRTAILVGDDLRAIDGAIELVPRVDAGTTDGKTRNDRILPGAAQESLLGEVAQLAAHLLVQRAPSSVNLLGDLEYSVVWETTEDLAGIDWVSVVTTALLGDVATRVAFALVSVPPAAAVVVTVSAVMLAKDIADERDSMRFINLGHPTSFRTWRVREGQSIAYAVAFRNSCSERIAYCHEEFPNELIAEIHPKFSPGKQTVNLLTRDELAGLPQGKTLLVVPKLVAGALRAPEGKGTLHTLFVGHYLNTDRRENPLRVPDDILANAKVALQ